MRRYSIRCRTLRLVLVGLIWSRANDSKAYAEDSSAPSFDCVFRKEGLIFDFRPLSRHVPWYYAKINATNGASFYFNPCGDKEIASYLPVECSASASPAYKKQENTCVSLGDFSATFTRSIADIDSSNPRKGISIVFEGGDPCDSSVEAGEERFNVVYDMKCSRDGHDEESGPQTVFEKGHCGIVVEWSTKHACPRNARTDMVVFLASVVVICSVAFCLICFAFNMIVRRRPVHLSSCPFSERLRIFFVRRQMTWTAQLFACDVASERIDFERFDAKHPMSANTDRTHSA